MSERCIPLSPFDLYLSSQNIGVRVRPHIIIALMFFHYHVHENDARAVLHPECLEFLTKKIAIGSKSMLVSRRIGQWSNAGLTENKVLRIFTIQGRIIQKIVLPYLLIDIRKKNKSHLWFTSCWHMWLLWEFIFVYEIFQSLYYVTFRMYHFTRGKY